MCAPCPGACSGSPVIAGRGGGVAAATMPSTAEKARESSVAVAKRCAGSFAMPRATTSSIPVGRSDLANPGAGGVLLSRVHTAPSVDCTVSGVEPCRPSHGPGSSRQSSHISSSTAAQPAPDATGEIDVVRSAIAYRLPDLTEAVGQSCAGDCGSPEPTPVAVCVAPRAAIADQVGSAIQCWWSFSRL